MTDYWRELMNLVCIIWDMDPGEREIEDLCSGLEAPAWRDL